MTSTASQSLGEVPPAPAAPPAGKPSLKSLTIRGSLWMVGGTAVSMVLRFASNLIVTHLLFPEAFGLMLIVNVFLQGLEMFSDLGIRVSIIQHARGSDPVFLNTAWTIQVLRGFALWLGACLIAWPAAGIYGHPELLQLIPVAAFVCVIGGFQSTSLSTLNRDMLVGRVTVLMLASQVVGAAVMIVWAWWRPSVWALVTPGLVIALLRTAFSHAVLPGIRNRFRWDPDARRALFGFGKWVFLSTAFTFLAGQSDRLLLPRYVDSAVLGVFSIAVTLSTSAAQVLWEVCQGVLMPAFSRVHREDSTRLRAVYEQVRARLDMLVLPGVGMLIVAGDVLVHALWDERYAEAGWMLQVLSVGMACFYMLPFAFACQAAQGNLRYWLAGNVGRTLWLFAGMPLAWRWGGLTATIWYVSLSQIPPLVFAWLRLRKDGILSLRRELLALGWLGAGLGLGWLAKAVFLARAAG